jgi:hypothetical protein
MMGDSPARVARAVDVVPVAGKGPRPCLPGLDESRAGDEAAYAKPVTVFSPWMRRVARKHVQSAGLAEDIVQETWAEVDPQPAASARANLAAAGYHLQVVTGDPADGFPAAAPYDRVLATVPATRIPYVHR